MLGNRRRTPIIETPLEQACEMGVSEGRVGLQPTRDNSFEARPMAPGGRPRRVQAVRPQSPSTQNEQQAQQESIALFIDPMMGTPLPIYVGEDIGDRENLVHLITVSVELMTTRLEIICSALII